MGGRHREETAVLGAVGALDAAAVDQEDLVAAGGRSRRSQQVASKWRGVSSA